MGHIAWLAAAHGAHSLAPRHRRATSSSYQPFILPFIQFPWLRARSSSLIIIDSYAQPPGALYKGIAAVSQQKIVLNTHRKHDLVTRGLHATTNPTRRRLVSPISLVSAFLTSTVTFNPNVLLP